MIISNYAKNIIIILLVCIIIYIILPPFGKIKRRFRKAWFTKPKVLKIDVKLNSINNSKKIIDSFIEDDLTKQFKNSKIKKFITYGLKNGKRVRPIILLSIFKHLANPGNKLPNYIIEAVLCIEYIHSASLVIDDIMDEDDERRGEETLHKKFGLTMAQLVALILVSISYQKICYSLKELKKQHIDKINNDFALIIHLNLADNITQLSMGQFLDINIPNNIPRIGDRIRDKINDSLWDIEDLIHKKTSSLFEISFIWAWSFTYFSKDEKDLKGDIEEMRILGRLFGLLFQIADDFEDVEQDLLRDGKNSVMNFVINKGYKAAHRKYHEVLEQFIKLSTEKGILTQEINEILNYLNKKVEVYFYHYQKQK